MKENLPVDEGVSSGREQAERTRRFIFRPLILWSSYRSAIKNIKSRGKTLAYQRSSWQSTDRFGGSGGGGRPSGNRSFGGFGSGASRGGGRFFETVNEMMPMGGGNSGPGRRQDPRAPPSYRDLDAPAEDII